MKAPRLEDVVDIPLGAVLADHAGVLHVFIGTRQSTRTNDNRTYYFMPQADAFRSLGTPSTYVHWGAAARKFPGLTKFRRP